MRISNELLDILGDYYNSEYVRLNKPWIRSITFEEFVKRYFASLNMIRSDGSAGNDTVYRG